MNFYSQRWHRLQQGKKLVRKERGKYESIQHYCTFFNYRIGCIRP